MPMSTHVLLYLWSSLGLVACIFGLFDVEIASLGYFPPIGQLSLSLNAPAYDVGVEVVNRKYRDVFNFSTVTYIADSRVSDCFSLYDNADYLLSRWFYAKRRKNAAPVLILPGCVAGATVNYLAANWKLLTIFSGDPPAGITDRSKSSSSISTAYVSIPTFVLAFHNLNRLYSWKSLFLILDEDSAPLYRGAVEQFMDLAKQIPDQHQTLTNIATKRNSSLEVILRQFKNISRDHGAYIEYDERRVYVAMEAFPMPAAYGNLTWQYQDTDDETAKDAFRSLLVIQPEDSHFPISSHARNLGRQFQALSAKAYNFSYPISRQPLVSILANYVSVLLVAQILNESLSHGLDIHHNGEMLANQFLCRRFNNDLQMVYVGCGGNRIPDLIVSQFTNDDDFSSLKPFLMQYSNATDGLVQIAVPEWEFGRHSWPPLNEPACGYRHEKSVCAKDPNDFINYVIPIAILISAALGAIVFWHFRFLYVISHDTWWTLNDQDIGKSKAKYLSAWYRHSNLHMNASSFAFDRTSKFPGTERDSVLPLMTSVLAVHE